MVSIEVRTNALTPANCDERFANREIIAREPATMPHAHTGKMVTLRCATRVLLAPLDGYELHAGDTDGPGDYTDIAYECFKCGMVFSTPQSVIAHNVTHIETFNTRYPLRTLQTLVRLMKYARRNNITDASWRVAYHLNVTGVSTLAGTQWNATQVQGLYDRWKNIIKVRITKNTRLIDLDASIDVPALSSAPAVANIGDDAHARNSAHEPTMNDYDYDDNNDDNNDDDDLPMPSSVLIAACEMVQMFYRMTRTIEALDPQLRALKPVIERLDDAVRTTTRPDPDIVDKATRWDEMQRLFNK